MSSVVRRSVDPATKTIFRAKKKKKKKNRPRKHSLESAKDTIATTADVTLVTLLRTLNRNLQTGKTHIVT